MKKRKIQESSTSLELNGDVYLVERRPGKRLKRTKLDGEVVLQCVVHVLERALREFGNE